MKARPCALIVVPQVGGGGTSRGVGRHWPTAVPPANAGYVALNPSVARHARTSCATSVPHAMPRSIGTAHYAQRAIGPVLAIVTQRRERRVITRLQLCQSRRKQAGQCGVGRGDHRRPARRAGVGPVVNENWCVTLLDAVVGIEDRRVNDRPQALTGGVRRVGRNQRVDENLIPFQYRLTGADDSEPVRVSIGEETRRANPTSKAAR